MLGISNIKYLSQRDPRWNTIKMGDSQVDIGHYGCLITCIAMASQFFGKPMTPDEIANHKDWFNSLGSFIWIKSDFPLMSFRWREGSESPMEKKKLPDMNMIKSYLSHSDNRPSDYNRVVILQVANESHWVLGLWEVDGDIMCIDPWFGKTCKVIETYGNITGAALFVKWDKSKPLPAWRGPAPTAPLYN
jgi:hypothetical protein